MTKTLFSTLLYLALSTSAVAEISTINEQTLQTTVLTLKEIIHGSLNEASARSAFNKIPTTKMYIKDGQYAGHKLYAKGKLAGLLSVKYKNNKPVIAGYSTVPLKVRHATKLYKSYRSMLLKHYKEVSHNHFDLGDDVIVELSKNLRSISIFVEQQ